MTCVGYGAICYNYILFVGVNAGLARERITNIEKEYLLNLNEFMKVRALGYFMDHPV